MSRIRTIKPEFWDDEKVASLSHPCRLFFIGTWNFADDNGVIRGNPSILKSKIFPYDDSLRVNEVSKWIDALVKARMLIPISYKSESYYVIRTFHSHQKFDPRYPNYLIPKEDFGLLYSPSEHPMGTQWAPAEHPLRDGEGEEGSNTTTPNGDSSIISDVNIISNSFCLKDNNAHESAREEYGSNVIDLIKGTVTGNWRNDFKFYKDGLRQIYTHFVNNEGFISEQAKYHPNVNIQLSLEKACVQYWATEAGWKKKKSSKSDIIDWKRTFINALNQPQNKVYEQRKANNSDKGAVANDFRARILRDIGTI